MKGYVPEIWCKVKVVFIPKPGKSSYTDPKSFRPISLMSFILKSLEKLVDRHIRETSLVVSPLHKFQYAYQAGKSTESALHLAVSKFERTVDNKEIGIAAFLDIEGAFDNTSFSAIKLAAEKFHIDFKLISWICKMLGSRVIKALLYDTDVYIRPTQGTPQGGCLSALLWSLVVDSLLCELNTSGGIQAVGYADDILIYVAGKFGATVSDVMQRALRISEKWCRKNSLSINPSKAVIIPITHRYKYNDLKPLKLFNSIVNYSKEAKYLGVILDTRLNWEAHLNYILNKTIRSFWACKSMVGKTWGLTPKMTRWIYNQILIPKLTYSCVVWWHRTRVTQFSEKLNKLQRMVQLSITGSLKSTPTAALNAALGLPPLEITIEAKARCTAVRLASGGLWFGTNRRFGHCSIDEFLDKNKTYWTNPDKISGCFEFTKHFEVIIKDRNSIFDFDNFNNSIVCYTDASKSNDGVGAGIYCTNLNIKQKIKIIDNSTVFQAELYAIIKCVEMLFDMSLVNNEIIIATDSQAALKAIMAYKISSRTVFECITALNKLGLKNKICLMWTPGHSGISGNETADELAREASIQDGVPLDVPFSDSLWKHDINRWTILKHKKLWNELPRLKVSKIFLKVDDKRTNELLSFCRNDLRLLIGLFTGHFRLNKYLFDIGISADSTCRFCHNSDETSSHLIFECQNLKNLRMKCFGSDLLTKESIKNIKYSNFVSFIKGSGLNEQTQVS
jgi:ribonuclease HI